MQRQLVEQETNRLMRNWAEKELSEGGQDAKQITDCFNTEPAATLDAGMFPTPASLSHVPLAVAEIRVPFHSLALKLLAAATPSELDTLRSDWEGNHKVVKHLEQPKLPAKKKRSSRNICFFARVCVCFRDSFRQFISTLLATTRTLCGPHSNMRHMLKQGTLVWRLHDAQSGFCLHYYVAYINLVTFRGAIIPLRLDKDHCQAAIAESIGGYALLPAKYPDLHWGTWWQIMGILDTSHHFSLDVGVLSSRMIAIDALCPALLLVEPYTHALLPSTFWKGPPPQKSTKRTRRNNQRAESPDVGGGNA